MKKRIWSILLVLCMVLSLVPFSASAAKIVASGTCKNNLTWTIDSDGVLTISGNGEMIPEKADSKHLTWRARGLYRTITAVVIKSGVTSIMTAAFNSCDHIERVSIPKSVTSIGDGAFSGCKSLSEITIPKSVTRIGSDAFQDSGLTSITIPGSVKHFNGGTFSNCQELTSVTISNGVNEICGDMFSGCSKLKTVSIPKSVTSIDMFAFQDCKSMTSIVIPASVKEIRGHAFAGCNKLTSVTIPDGVTDIQDGTFESCTKLASVKIPKSVERISDDAFFGCVNLKSINVSADNTCYSSVDGCLFNSDRTELICVPEGITGKYVIPNSVDSIHRQAFMNCSRLTSIVIPDSVKGIWEYAFFGCSGLKDVSIPESVDYIGERSFSGCTGLRSLVIPESVEYIGGGAFADCSSLEQVVIGSGLNGVGSGVFDKCKHLQDVLFAGTKKEWRFERDGESEDGTTALGLSNRVRIHFNVQDPATHIREKTAATGNTPARYCCDCGFEFPDPSASVIPMSKTGIPSALSEDYGIVTADGTRYGLTRMLWTIAGSPKPSSMDNPFLDVTGEMEPAVLWAVEEGISSGVDRNNFHPSGTCARAQVVTYLWRYAGNPNPAITEVPFTDAEQGTYWYNALLWAYESGAVAFEKSQKLFEPNQMVESISFDPRTGVFRLYSDSSQMQEEASTIRVGGMGDGNGNFTVTDCYVPSNVPMPKTLVVPETIHGDIVVALDYHAFEDLGTLKELYLPLSIREVFDSAFPASLKNIYYAGCSQTQWNRIVFHSVDLSGITIHYRAHSWDTGTLDDGGLRHYTCTSCGETKTAVEKKAKSGVKVLAEPTQAAALNSVTLVAEKNTNETKAAANIVVKSVSGVKATHAYDIHLENAKGMSVQPKSAITVVIPLPDGWDPNGVAVYYVDPNNGNTENMNASVSSDGKTVSFETTHFSCYVLTQTNTNVDPAPASGTKFQDVKKDAYYYDPVAWAVNHDPVVTTGTDKTHFSPSKDCTRAQMVTFLWRAAGEPKPESTKNPFKDVKKGAYYYDAVLWAVGEGITTGTSKNTFSPDATVTRAQTVTFLWRMANEPAVKAKNPFQDVKKGTYYYDAVLWAVANNITTGKTAKTFAPGDPCTRAQIVTFLYRDLG